MDGNTTGTRWESQYSDPQYMYVDLGVPCTIHTVKLSWENAAGKTYTIDVSNDGLHPEVQNGSNWTRLATETNGGSMQTYPSTLTGTYRYVRMFGTTRTTGYGYSLWDFEVLRVVGAAAARRRARRWSAEGRHPARRGRRFPIKSRRPTIRRVME